MAQASNPSQPDSDTAILKQALSNALDAIAASHRTAVMKAFHAELGAELKTQGTAGVTLLPAAQATKLATVTALQPARSAKSATGEARATTATRKTRPRAARGERAAQLPLPQTEQHTNGAAAA